MSSELERLYLAADDDELDVLDVVAFKAGLKWKCDEGRNDRIGGVCGWVNLENDPVCGNCGAAKPNGDVTHAINDLAVRDFVIRTAADLLGDDAESVNPEYTRAMVELTSDLLGYREEDRDIVKGLLAEGMNR